MHHRRSAVNKGRENLFWLLFLLLAYLSVIRIIELLPPSTPSAQPVMAPSQAEQGKATSNDEGNLAPERALPACETGIQVTKRGLDLRGREPRILIYHTHTTEAYTATPSSPYVQTSSFRTADASKSVIAVGEALAERLRTEYGFCVLHDTTDHEPPSLKTAYTRSEQTMRAYLEEYPSLVLFIDLHRDASSDASDYVIVDGRPTARLMCVVGQGTNYEDKPDFEGNYALAATLTDALRRVNGKLARDIRIKTGRYNQHVGQLSLLLEVGHNANTLEQALNAVPSLAECLALSLADMAFSKPEALTVPLMLPLWPQSAGIDKE